MSNPISKLAEDYILLAHRFDKHQKGVVDAHYGKASDLKKITDAEDVKPIGDLQREAQAILEALKSETSERATYLQKQTTALKTMIAKKRKAKFSYVDEANLCLGISKIQWQPDEPMLAAMNQLDKLLKGTGSISDRYVAWRSGFELKGEEISNFIYDVMKEAKAKTHHLFHGLPENEVAVSLVQNQPWAGYHWYKGKFKSLYELNTDVPMTVWGILHTTTHEAFCGHHTEAIVKEKFLVQEKGYDEFSINLLGTPCSLISEGVAEAAQSLIFGDFDEAMTWLRQKENLHGKKITDTDIEILRATESIGRKPAINAALMLHEQGKSDDDVVAYLKTVLPSEESLQRRTVGRLRDEDYRTYMLTYPMGKEKILNELNQSSDKAQTFFNILKAVDYKFAA
jgi:hypothetical protein